MYLTCFYALNSTGYSINGSIDNLLIFLYQFLSLKVSTCLVREAQQENRLQAHSFIQEWILSPHIWFPFANRHKYSVTASECTGNNRANCSLWWLRRCSETEQVCAMGGCKALRSESLWCHSPRAAMFTSALTTPHTYVHHLAQGHLNTSHLIETTQLTHHLLHTLLPTNSLAIPYQDHRKCQLFSKAFPDDPSQPKWWSPLATTPTGHCKPTNSIYAHLTFFAHLTF